MRHPRPVLLAALTALVVAVAFVASPGADAGSAVVAGGRIDIRGQQHLFAIGDAPAS